MICGIHYFITKFQTKIDVIILSRFEQMWVIFNDLKLDGIMHKWANPHFDDFEKKSRCNMKYRIKQINTN